MCNCILSVFRFIYFNFVELGEIFRNLKSVCVCSCVEHIQFQQKRTDEKILTPILIPSAYVMHNGICRKKERTQSRSCHMHDALNGKFLLKDYRIRMHYYRYKLLNRIKSLLKIEPNRIVRIDLISALYLPTFLYALEIDFPIFYSKNRQQNEMDFVHIYNRFSRRIILEI